MLRDEAKRYIESQMHHGLEGSLYHYNCAEVILNSSNDYYRIGLDEKAIKMIAPFGSGINTGKACGMLIGGAAAIGAIFTEDKPSKNLKMKKITQEWVKEFEKEFKHTDCIEVKEMNLKEGQGCGNLMLKSADILEAILKKYL